MEALNKFLQTEAIKLGLCRQWTEEWDMNGDYSTLAYKYKKGLDFCIKHNFPSNEFIKEFFDESFLLENHVYIDMTYNDSDAKSDFYVIQGSSKVSLVFKGYSAATIWVRHNSEVNIIAKGYAKLNIRVLDNSKLTVHQNEDAKVFVKKKSSESTIECTGVVDIKY